MKLNKLLVAVSLAFATFAVQAADDNFVHAQYTFRDTIGSNQGETNRQGINLTYGRKIGDNLQIDLGEQFRTEKLNEHNNGGTSATRLEAGATYVLPVSDTFSLYTRGAVGYKFATNEDFGYYSVEPGIKFQATKELSVKAGYRYRDSFSQAYFDKTNTVRLAAQYDVTKDSFVTAGVDRAYGDSEFLGVNLGYGIKF